MHELLQGSCVINCWREVIKGVVTLGTGCHAFWVGDRHAGPFPYRLFAHDLISFLSFSQSLPPKKPVQDFICEAFAQPFNRTPPFSTNMKITAIPWCVSKPDVTTFGFAYIFSAHDTIVSFWWSLISCLRCLMKWEPLCPRLFSRSRNYVVCELTKNKSS